MLPAMLIVFGGLPATGKTTLARQIARAFAATYLRIDTIEQALRDSGEWHGGPGAAGYIVGYWLAAGNLRQGQVVVADSVNPIALTRDAWRQVAETAGARLIEVEVICSDPVEHRHRVETREIDVPGLTPPDWATVTARDYEPWPEPHLVIDTAHRDIDACVIALRAMIDEALQAPD